MILSITFDDMIVNSTLPDIDISPIITLSDTVELIIDTKDKSPPIQLSVILVLVNVPVTCILLETIL